MMACHVDEVIIMICQYPWSIACPTDSTTQTGIEVQYGEVVQLRHTQTQLFLRVSSSHSPKLQHTNVLLELSSTYDRGTMFRILPRNKVAWKEMQSSD